MAQKVLRIGTSAGITISKQDLEKLNWTAGDEVEVQVDEKNQRLIVKPVAAVDAELVSWTRQFIEKYRDALLALKDA